MRDDLDRWLSDDEAIVPSSGFAQSVMDAVQREASAPAAIPFPWTRAMPGLVVTGVSLAATAVSIWRAAPDAPAFASFDQAIRSLLLSVADNGANAAAGVIIAVIMTVLPVVWSVQLMRSHS